MRQCGGTERGTALDERAIRDFLSDEYPRLVAGVALVCGSRAAAEDAVQEALARAWERSERGEYIESVVAWVRTVALNLSRSWLRRVRAEARARERLGRAEEREARTDEALDMRNALAALPYRQRVVTVLRYYGGLDVTEISRELGIKQATVKTILFRARRALAAQLREDDEREELADVEP